MNEEIYSIVGFHEIVELAHSMKELYTFTREWENAKNRMKKVAETLEEAIVAVREFTGKSSIRESRRSNPVEQFIQDKKFMETLVKSNNASQHRGNAVLRRNLRDLETVLLKIHECPGRAV